MIPKILHQLKTLTQRVDALEARLKEWEAFDDDLPAGDDTVLPVTTMEPGDAAEALLSGKEPEALGKMTVGQPELIRPDEEE